eukprot:COSAG03_NODE_2939_length_2341_cov_2.720785_3_plen_341_part_00
MGTQVKAQFCSTRPFKIHFTEDGQELLRVEVLEPEAIEAALQAVRGREEEELKKAQMEADRQRELERAVPENCALCGEGEEERGQLGELLAFQVPKDQPDAQTWRAHRHCLQYCQTVMDSNGRGKHKKVEEHGMVALKYLNDPKKCITPGQAVKDCWAKRCSHCQERGAHLACHVPTCKKVFHLRCANAPENCVIGEGVAVCRDATSQRDEETDAYLMGHGPKDTFCAEHSAGRPAEEFAPIVPDSESDTQRKAGKYRDSDSSSSSSSEDDDDDVTLSEWLPGAKKRKRSPGARTSPAQALQVLALLSLFRALLLSLSLTAGTCAAAGVWCICTGHAGRG